MSTVHGSYTHNTSSSIRLKSIQCLHLAYPGAFPVWFRVSLAWNLVWNLPHSGIDDLEEKKTAVTEVDVEGVSLGGTADEVPAETVVVDRVVGDCGGHCVCVCVLIASMDHIHAPTFVNTAASFRCKKVF